ncbi:MAG: M1 family metallopeptidase [Clostridia bacterium]|nr:M1 family metallopeptidase [Clostridia bacterium]
MKRFFSRFFIIGLILISAIGLSACGKKKDDLNQIGENFTNYYIDLEYKNQSKSAVGVCGIDYYNSSEALLKEVKLHLYIANFCFGAKNKPVSETTFNSAYPNGESFASLNISKVMLNGEDVVPCYEGEDNDIMVVSLKSSLYPSERVNLEIEYNFSLPNCNHRFGYGENTINFGNFYPIVCAYNNGWLTDSYSVNGDPFCSDMANYYVNLALEENLILASTGEILNQTTDSSITYYNIEAKCVRDYAFVLSEKFNVASKTVDGIEFKYYYTADENFEKSLQCGIDAISTFSDLFYKYPYKTYSVVQADFCYGGMEYPNLSIISNSVTNLDDYLNVIVHETAHQWWFNLVGNDEYNESWLDESLTEFSTIMFYDHNKGYNFNHKDMINSAHQNYVFYHDVFEKILGGVNSSMTRPLNEFETEPEYTYTIYVKGVLMFDSLYNLIGEKKFVKALKMYAENYSYKIACGSDLIACFEDSYKASLEDFFSCWLEGKVIIN